MEQHRDLTPMHLIFNISVRKEDLGKASKKNRFFLGKSPKLWVGGGQES